jgi:hypothetical protein
LAKKSTLDTKPKEPEAQLILKKKTTIAIKSNKGSLRSRAGSRTSSQQPPKKHVTSTFGTGHNKEPSPQKPQYAFVQGLSPEKVNEEFAQFIEEERKFLELIQA